MTAQAVGTADSGRQQTALLLKPNAYSLKPPVRLASGVAPQPDRYESKRPPCRHCGGTLHFVAITDSSGRVLVSRPLPSAALADHVTNFLDSG